MYDCVTKDGDDDSSESTNCKVYDFVTKDGDDDSSESTNCKVIDGGTSMVDKKQHITKDNQETHEGSTFVSYQHVYLQISFSQLHYNNICFTTILF